MQPWTVAGILRATIRPALDFVANSLLFVVNFAFIFILIFLSNTDSFESSNALQFFGGRSTCVFSHSVCVSARKTIKLPKIQTKNDRFLIRFYCRAKKSARTSDLLCGSTSLSRWICSSISLGVFTAADNLREKNVVFGAQWIRFIGTSYDTPSAKMYTFAPGANIDCDFCTTHKTLGALTPEN